MSVEETVIEQYGNLGGFKLQVIAQLAGPGISNVRYMIRLIDREGKSLDFMTDLEGFRKLGELLLALHQFAKLKVFAKENGIARLRELLTPDNIKNFADIIKTAKGQL